MVLLSHQSHLLDAGVYLIAASGVPMLVWTQKYRLDVLFASAAVLHESVNLAFGVAQLLEQLV